jgi:hypothetical protein
MGFFLFLKKNNLSGFTLKINVLIALLSSKFFLALTGDRIYDLEVTGLWAPAETGSGQTKPEGEKKRTDDAGYNSHSGREAFFRLHTAKAHLSGYGFHPAVGEFPPPGRRGS